MQIQKTPVNYIIFTQGCFTQTVHLCYTALYTLFCIKGALSLNKLEQARVTIDEIDAQMARLFSARMDAVQQVVAYKIENDLPVLDAGREQAVIDKNIARLPNAHYAELYTDYIKHTMALSRAYQKQILGQNIVAYQGVEGAFSHIALQALFPHANALAFATWAQVFTAVQNGDASLGVLPFENSQAGDVADVLDLCFAHNIYVQDVVDLPVHQNLLCTPGATLADIQQIYSHPQAISQCARFLTSIGISATPMENTAVAAKFVAESGNKSFAAIASSQTAALYGLQVLAPDINTAATNTTRFIVIGQKPVLQGTSFSLLFTVAHQAGSLAKVIDAIASEGYNMESIKSRPMPDSAWEYYFYAEIEGSLTSETQNTLLQHLQKICKNVRVLGCYTKRLLDV